MHFSSDTRDPGTPFPDSSVVRGTKTTERQSCFECGSKDASILTKQGKFLRWEGATGQRRKARGAERIGCRVSCVR